MRKFFSLWCVALALTAFIGCGEGDGAADTGVDATTEEMETDALEDETAPADGAATEEPATEEATP